MKMSKKVALLLVDIGLTYYYFFFVIPANCRLLINIIIVITVYLDNIRSIYIIAVIPESKVCVYSYFEYLVLLCILWEIDKS